MRIYKNKDITTNIDTEKISINNSDTYFYTEDKGSTALRIFINHRETAFNLDNTNLTPVLDLFHADGSIWLDEPLEVIMADKGLLQYNIPNNVIAHAGKVKAKLFLRNAEQSVHVANFTFDIKDSGIEGAIEKEISVNLVDDAVRRIMNEQPEIYKGEKGDKGDTGPMGDITGTEGWQKIELTDSQGNVLFLYQTDFNDVEKANLKTGFYYVSDGRGLPEGVSNYGYIVFKRLNDNIQRLEYSPFNSSQIFIKNKVDYWGDWLAVGISAEEMKKIQQKVDIQAIQLQAMQQQLAKLGGTN